ncbi:MAG: 50S ribosomal protein L23 [Planctomycetota bacterium]
MQKAEAYQLILKPILTEKSTAEQERLNVYRFAVAGGANRIEIAQAVEMLFEVKVDSVNTMLRPGKMRRRGASYFQSPATKIALVKLKAGEKIDLL